MLNEEKKQNSSNAATTEQLPFCGQSPPVPRAHVAKQDEEARFRYPEKEKNLVTEPERRRSKFLCFEVEPRCPARPVATKNKQKKQKVHVPKEPATAVHVLSALRSFAGCVKPGARSRQGLQRNRSVVGA